MFDFPSVTQILEPQSGIAELKRRKPEVLEAAAERGTLVHGYCQGIAEGFPPLEIRPDLEGYVRSFQQWFVNVEHVEHTELRLMDMQNGFHGQFDIVCRLRGDKGLSLWDFKTPEAAQKTWPCQVAAYRHLAKIAGIRTIRGGSVRLRKDGAMPIIGDYTASAHRDWALFVSCLNVYNAFWR